MSVRSKTKFPSVADVARSLRDVQPRDVRSVEDVDGEEIDVRLQVLDHGRWYVHTGDASYDTDHHGYWGAGSVPWRGRFDSTGLARDLIDQARESEAQGRAASPSQKLAPKIGDVITVHGKRCRVFKVYNYGTVDVEEIDGPGAWRVTGLGYTGETPTTVGPRSRKNATAGASRAKPVGYRCRGCGTVFKRRPGTCIVCARRKGGNRTEGTKYPISYSDGRTIADPIVVIGEDLSTERRGNWYRAFWTESLESSGQSPVFGYASGQGGPYRTVRAAAAEVRRYQPDARIYRSSDGRRVR